MMDYTKCLVNMETKCPQRDQRRAQCPNLQGGQGSGNFVLATMAESKRLNARAATDFAILYVIAFRPEIKGECHVTYRMCWYRQYIGGLGTTD